MLCCAVHVDGGHKAVISHCRSIAPGSSRAVSIWGGGVHFWHMVRGQDPPRIGGQQPSLGQRKKNILSKCVETATPAMIPVSCQPPAFSDDLTIATTLIWSLRLVNLVGGPLASKPNPAQTGHRRGQSRRRSRRKRMVASGEV